MRVQLFGPGRVTNGDDGHITQLGVLQLRIMAQLVVAADVGCQSDNLITYTWPDPPSTARVSLRNHVMRLRGLLGDPAGEKLRSTARGYVLDMAVDEVDIWSFETRVATGRQLLESGSEAEAQAGAERLEEALALWVGLPFAGCEDLADGRAAMLQAEFMAASVTLAERWLGCDDAIAATRVIRQGQALDPFDERLFRCRLRAVRALGQGTHKLTEVYDTYVNLLDDELGVRPDPGTVELYNELKSSAAERAAAALAAPPSSGPSSTGQSMSGQGASGPACGLVGREAELDLLARFLSSPQRLACISGARGTGKSEVLQAAAAMASSTNGVVPIECTDGDGIRCLAERLAGAAPTLVVVDDLDHMSEEDVDALVAVAQTAKQHRLLVAHSAGWSGAAAEAWQRCEDDMAMRRLYESVSLTNVDREGTHRLVEKFADQGLDESECDEIHSLSGGNPSVVRDLVESGHRPGHEPPAQLKRAVLGEIRQFDTDVVTELEVFAALGPTVDLAGIDLTPAVSEAVEASLRAGVLVESDGAQSLHFGVPLVGTAIYESLSRGRRLAIHKQLAEQLRDHPSRRRDAADHALKAEPVMGLADVYEIVRAGASTAAERGDAAESTALYLNAVRLHRLVHDEDQASLTELVIDLYGCVDDTSAPEVVEAWHLAVDGARGRRDPRLVLRLAESRLDRWMGANADFKELLAEALEWCDESDGEIRVRLQIRLALELSEAAAWPEVYELAVTAERSARQLGDPSTICQAVRAVLANSYRDVSASERLRRSHDLTNSARLQLDPDMQMIGMVYEALELVNLGERTAPISQLQDIEALAIERRRPRYQAMVETIRAGLATAKGDEAGATAALERLARLIELTPNRDAGLALLGHEVLYRWAMGNQRESVDMLIAEFESNPPEYFLTFLTGTALAEVGDLDRLAKVMSDVDYDRLPSGLIYPSLLAFGTEIVVAMEDRPAAETLIEQLAPLHGTTLVFLAGVAILGPAEGYEAELRWLTGDRSRSNELFDQAIESATANGDTFLVKRLERRRHLVTQPG